MCRMPRAVVTLHNRKKGDFDPSLNFKQQQQFPSPRISIDIELLISRKFQSRYFRIKFRSGFFATHAERDIFSATHGATCRDLLSQVACPTLKNIIVFYFLLASVINDMIALRAR